MLSVLCVQRTEVISKYTRYSVRTHKLISCLCVCVCGSINHLYFPDSSPSYSSPDDTPHTHTLTSDTTSPQRPVHTELGGSLQGLFEATETLVSMVRVAVETRRDSTCLSAGQGQRSEWCHKEKFKFSLFVLIESSRCCCCWVDV